MIQDPMVQIPEDEPSRVQRLLDKEWRVSIWALSPEPMVCGKLSPTKLLMSLSFTLDPWCGHSMSVTSFCTDPSSLFSGFLYSFRDSSCCQPVHSTIWRYPGEQLELSQGLILHHWVCPQIFPVSCNICKIYKGIAT
jgi:hypothetical protein